MFYFKDHLKNGVVTFSGNYKDTGEPLHITHIKWKNFLKPKCTLKCLSGKKNECLSPNLSDVTDGIKKQIHFLGHLKHENLLGYKTAIITENENWKNIYIIREVEKKSTSAKSISRTTKWTYGAIGNAITSMIKAIRYLHQNNIPHGHLKNSSIFVNDENVWKVADFFLVSYIHHIARKNDNSCYVPNERADVKAIAQLIESFEIQSEPLHNFVKLCKNSIDIELIVNDKLFKKISKFSRLEAEFEIDSYLGEGAFGDVLKVKSYTDKTEYAMKRVKLSSKSPREFNNAKKEARSLSKLRHKHVVQYHTSWTEIVDESIFNSYRPPNGNHMDVE